MSNSRNWMPNLPPKARLVVADVVPWLALIFGIIGLLAILPLFLVSFLMVSPFLPLTSTWYLTAIITLVCGLVASVLDLLAFQPLMRRKQRGWIFLFSATTLSFLTVSMQALFGYGSAAAVLSTLIGFWLLFEIRGLYRAS